MKVSLQIDAKGEIVGYLVLRLLGFLFSQFCISKLGLSTHELLIRVLLFKMNACIVYSKNRVIVNPT